MLKVKREENRCLPSKQFIFFFLFFHTVKECVYMSENQKNAWTFIITLLIIQKKAGKNMFNALSPSFTGKNSRWQPASVDVASLCDVIIKGDKSSQGNMRKDK